MKYICCFSYHMTAECSDLGLAGVVTSDCQLLLSAPPVLTGAWGWEGAGAASSSSLSCEVSTVVNEAFGWILSTLLVSFQSLERLCLVTAHYQLALGHRRTRVCQLLWPTREVCHKKGFGHTSLLRKYTFLLPACRWIMKKQQTDGIIALLTQLSSPISC